MPQQHARLHSFPNFGSASLFVALQVSRYIEEQDVPEAYLPPALPAEEEPPKPGQGRGRGRGRGRPKKIKEAVGAEPLPLPDEARAKNARKRKQPEEPAAEEQTQAASSSCARAERTKGGKPKSSSPKPKQQPAKRGKAADFGAKFRQEQMQKEVKEKEQLIEKIQNELKEMREHPDMEVSPQARELAYKVKVAPRLQACATGYKLACVTGLMLRNVLFGTFSSQDMLAKLTKFMKS